MKSQRGAGEQEPAVPQMKSRFEDETDRLCQVTAVGLYREHSEGTEQGEGHWRPG